MCVKTKCIIPSKQHFTIISIIPNSIKIGSKNKKNNNNNVVIFCLQNFSLHNNNAVVILKKLSFDNID